MKINHSLTSEPGIGISVKEDKNQKSPIPEADVLTSHTEAGKVTSVAAIKAFRVVIKCDNADYAEGVASELQTYDYHAYVTGGYFVYVDSTSASSGNALKNTVIRLLKDLNFKVESIEIQEYLRKRGIKDADPTIAEAYGVKFPPELIDRIADVLRGHGVGLERNNFGDFRIAGIMADNHDDTFCYLSFDRNTFRCHTIGSSGYTYKDVRDSLIKLEAILEALSDLNELSHSLVNH